MGHTLPSSYIYIFSTFLKSLFNATFIALLCVLQRKQLTGILIFLFCFLTSYIVELSKRDENLSLPKERCRQLDDPLEINDEVSANLGNHKSDFNGELPAGEKFH